MGSDSRIGPHFLFPGVGYGGSCFPKDIDALMQVGEEAGYPLRILEAVKKVNDDQKRLLVDKVKDVFGSDLHGRSCNKGFLDVPAPNRVGMAGWSNPRIAARQDLFNPAGLRLYFFPAAKACRKQ